MKEVVCKIKTTSFFFIYVHSDDYQLVKQTPINLQVRSFTQFPIKRNASTEIVISHYKNVSKMKENCQFIKK